MASERVSCLGRRPSAAKVVALEVLGGNREKVAISIEVGDTLAAASKQVSWETKKGGKLLSY